MGQKHMETLYFWRDEPIEDIEKWAKERGEKMYDVTFQVRDVNPYARKAKNMITYHEETETMPQSFWNSLRMDDRKTPIRWTIREPRV